MVKGLADAMRVVFDDERVVANAGVMLPAVLAGRLGLETLVDQAVDLGGRGSPFNAQLIFSPEVDGWENAAGTFLSPVSYVEDADGQGLVISNANPLLAHRDYVCADVDLTNVYVNLNGGTGGAYDVIFTIPLSQADALAALEKGLQHAGLRLTAAQWSRFQCASSEPTVYACSAVIKHGKMSMFWSATVRRKLGDLAVYYTATQTLNLGCHHQGCVKHATVAGKQYVTN
jgi:hypothetical protein